jgi:GT2 family glycosyltransferase
MPQTEARAPGAAGATQTLRAPSVLVVLVTKDGAGWLRQCLLGLSRQTHPRIGVVAVDNGSADGSFDLLASALGPDRVIRMERNRGFAAGVAEALRSPIAPEADYLLLLHDDTVLAPDAVSRLVEAAERIEGAAVVGPKVLDWEQPGLLREIGMSTDRFGYPYSPLEEGEIDQGQYDRVREVMFVSSSAMLVSREAWNRIGLPDERFEASHEALDFCWRARVAGFRVLMTPAAEARHHDASRRGDRSGVRERTRYERERAALASVLKNYGPLSVLWILPAYFAIGVARVVLLTLGRRFADAYEVLAAWGWNLAHLPGTIRRRARAQAIRSVPDRDIRPYMAPSGERLRRWMGAARTALFPTRISLEDVEDDEDAGMARVREPLRVRFVRFAVAHPVALAWAIGLAVMGLAYRDLFGASPLAGGGLPAFPSSPAGFFRELVSGVRSTGLGGTGPASPALAILGGGSVLTLGSPALLQKALLLGLPPVAAVGAYRAIRAVAGERVPAVVSAAAYALSAVVLWSVSEGRIAELAFLAGLPWLATKLTEAFAPSGRPANHRWVAGAGLGLAVLASFFPGVLLAAVLVVGAALLVPAAGGSRGRGLALAGAAGLAAAVLALPVTMGLVHGSGGGMADLVGFASFARVARLSPGPGPGGWLPALSLPVAAAFALAFVPPGGIRPAVRAAVAGTGGLYLAWMAAAGYLPAALSNPVAYLGVSAFSFSLVVGLGLSSLMAGMAARSFGHRQVGTVLLSTVLGLGLASQAIAAAAGSWTVGGPDRLPAAYPLVGRAGPPNYRVLWLGSWSGGPLPAPAGQPDGRVAAGEASVRFAVTGPAGATALDLGRSADGPGYDRLRAALAEILTGRTRHGGALLAPFGIRFVVATPSGVPMAVQTLLGGQLDMGRLPAGGLVIYRDPKAAPVAATVAGPEWVRGAREGDPRGWSSLPAPDATPLDGGGERLVGRGGGGGLILLSQQFDRSWRLLASSGAARAPERAFGWGVGFPAPAGRFEVRFGGQRLRDVMLVFLAVLWIAALWITRRPARGG